MYRCLKVNGENRYLIFCPACKHGHVFDDRWTFNTSMEFPTFRPSILVTVPELIWEGKNYPATRCHSYVTNGKIEYLPDCTHKFAGLTLDLPDPAP